MHVDIDVLGYDVRGMIAGVIVPCFTTFISYLVIRDLSLNWKHFNIISSFAFAFEGLTYNILTY